MIDVFLKEYDGSITQDPTLDQLNEALRSLDPAGKLFLILKTDRQHYIQTHINEEGEFELEFRDGSNDRHYFVDSPSPRSTMIEAFTSYYRGTNVWRTIVEWQRERVR